MNRAPHGILFVATDVDAADDAELNDWYDHEHVEERAAVAGFISAARYQAVRGGKRYLGLYRTTSLAAFTSDAYKAAFGQQTAWSVANLDRMVDPMRRVCAMSAVVGQGSGSWLSVLPLDGAADPTALTTRVLALNERQAVRPGFVQAYLLLPDVGLSTPLPKESRDGRHMLPLLVTETSSHDANEAALAGAISALPTDAGQAACYALKWKLYSSELASDRA